MKKIRIGNDFVFNWAIERGGLPEDLGSVLEAKLTASVFGKKQEVPFTVSGNIITIEFTPEICNVIGSYNLLFTYILPDTGLSDEDRKCAVDVDAFQIVARTAQADDSTEFSMTSDMAIAFKGDKGDSAYQVWLEAGNTGTEADYFEYLRQPAIDAGTSISELEGEIQVNEGLRVQAESERVQAESERQITIQEAVTATQEATTAASLADTARLAIQDDLALKANQTDLEQLESNMSVSVVNFVANGDFANGLSGWIAAQSVNTIEGGKLINTGDGTHREPSVRVLIPTSVIGDKYYIKAIITDKTGFCDRVRILIVNDLVWNVSNPVANTRYIADDVVTVSGNYGQIGIYHRYVTAAESNGSAIEVEYVMGLNLSQIFGLGNEPTKAEIYTLMQILGNQYFEGEITLTQKQLMNWQLKMIRQNRSAIIALGGTIV